jgi:hypothetical protein
MILSLDNQGSFWPVQLAIELSAARTLRFTLAAGIVWAQGRSEVGVHGRNPVRFQADDDILTQFIADHTEVSVDASVGGQVGPWWQGFVSATPAWAVGAFRFGLPVTWRVPGGVGIGVEWGIAL